MKVAIALAVALLLGVGCGESEADKHCRFDFEMLVNERSLNATMLKQRGEYAAAESELAAIRQGARREIVAAQPACADALTPERTR